MSIWKQLQNAAKPDHWFPLGVVIKGGAEYSAGGHLLQYVTEANIEEACADDHWSTKRLVAARRAFLHNHSLEASWLLAPAKAAGDLCDSSLLKLENAAQGDAEIMSVALKNLINIKKDTHYFGVRRHEVMVPLPIVIKLLRLAKREEKFPAAGKVLFVLVSFEKMKKSKHADWKNRLKGEFDSLMKVEIQADGTFQHNTIRVNPEGAVMDAMYLSRVWYHPGRFRVRPSSTGQAQEDVDDDQDILCCGEEPPLDFEQL
jgi:hypothetical protein